MAKRFSATEIWDEDWFLELPIEYKLFWFYMLSSCDHGGFYKVNLKSFCALNEVKINSEKAIELFNNKKERVRVLKDGFWFIEDFISFQYGHKLNPNNRMHESVIALCSKFKVKLNSIRGLIEVNDKSNGVQGRG